MAPHRLRAPAVLCAAASVFPVVLLAALVVPRDARACSCAGNLPAEQLKSANLVVEGTLRDHVNFGFSGDLYLIEVSRVFKGPAQQWIVVQNGPCGTGMPEGPAYLYLSDSGLYWSLDTCDGGHSVADAKQILTRPKAEQPQNAFGAELNHAVVLEKEPTRVPEPGMTPLWVMVWLQPWLLLVLPMGAGAGLVLLRRVRRAATARAPTEKSR